MCVVTLCKQKLSVGPVNFVVVGGGGGRRGGSGIKASHQFFFCSFYRSAIFFSGHVPCKFVFTVIFFSEGEGWGVKFGSICDSP